MPVVTAFIWSVVAISTLVIVFQPAGLSGQFALSVTIIGILVAMRLTRLDRIWRHIFLALATIVVLRYAYWRTTSTLPPVSDLASFGPGLLLYFAEMYAIVMLGISLFVVADPKKRAPATRPEPATAPSVDVLVPSFNESADILALTLSAAKAMDYPAGKLTVTLLDDGATQEKLNASDRMLAAAAHRRAVELKALCAELGVNYFARARNVHAKAGNLNAGLSVTQGDLVVVFDADHAPERNFLTETVGYFGEDPKLFLVQTPHFFANPDPVERNLRTFDDMPSENEMFYGRIQAGLDRWNAAFFCGSAAVLRRKALEQSGGFSGITVTEDCETALELHAKGWAAPAWPVSANRLTTPRGNFCSSSSGLRKAALNRTVWGAGFITQVQPAARAGARARTSRTAGAFQGMINAATPAGSRSIVENSPGATSSTWPGLCRASPA